MPNLVARRVSKRLAADSEGIFDAPGGKVAVNGSPAERTLMLVESWTSATCMLLAAAELRTVGKVTR